MNEIIFIVKESPEGGYEGRALGFSIIEKGTFGKAVLIRQQFVQFRSGKLHICDPRTTPCRHDSATRALPGRGQASS